MGLQRVRRDWVTNTHTDTHRHTHTHTHTHTQNLKTWCHETGGWQGYESISETGSTDNYNSHDLWPIYNPNIFSHMVSGVLANVRAVAWNKGKDVIGTNSLATFCFQNLPSFRCDIVTQLNHRVFKKRDHVLFAVSCPYFYTCCKEETE